MPVRSDLGLIVDAIEKGIKAESKIDYGPVPDISMIINEQRSAADFSNYPSSPGTFIMGIDRWANLTKKVTS